MASYKINHLFWKYFHYFYSMKIVYFNDLKIEFDNHKRFDFLPDQQKILYPDLDRLVVDLMSNKFINDLALLSDDPEALFLMFCAHFKLLKAAGGLVRNADGKYLFIKRFERWDFPKGKAEEDELPFQTALREVEEETGVSLLSIVSVLPETWHIYHYHDENVLKLTYWFLMYSFGDEPLIPQINELITEAVWLSPQQSRQSLVSSYRSLRETFGELLV